MIWLNWSAPSVCTPGANQYVLPAWLRSIELLSPVGTTIAPAGGVAGPFKMEVLPQILAGGALGHVPPGAGGGDVVVVVVDGFGTEEVGGDGGTDGGVDEGGTDEGGTDGGTDEDGTDEGADGTDEDGTDGGTDEDGTDGGTDEDGTDGGTDEDGTDGGTDEGGTDGGVDEGGTDEGGVAVELGDAGSGRGVTPLLATVKCAWRRAMVPVDHRSTTLMLWDPLASLRVLKGSALPSAAVPAKSKGRDRSMWMGDFRCPGSSR